MLGGKDSERTFIVCILQIEKLRPRKVSTLVKMIIALKKGEHIFELRSTDSRL